ncbi:hypothetical protein ATM97_28580 [Nocardia sp. MH4]|nr:hypothetical protein [Nocardia sp. MH4]
MESVRERRTFQATIKAASLDHRRGPNDTDIDIDSLPPLHRSRTSGGYAASDLARGEVDTEAGEHPETRPDRRAA